MSLNRDEARAAAFIAALLLVSGAVRWLDRPEPITIDAPGVDVAALEAESRRSAAGARQPTRPPVRAPGPTRTEPAREPDRLDLNRATALELERLPRVGPVLAGRIVTLRDSLGGFRDVAQLEQVRGIGPVMLERLTPLVRVGAKD